MKQNYLAISTAYSIFTYCILKLAQGLLVIRVTINANEEGIMDKKMLLESWKYLRGSHEGYLLGSLLTWSLVKDSIFNRHLPMMDRIIVSAYESQYCRSHNC
jgi:hypothetical protein